MKKKTLIFFLLVSIFTLNAQFIFAEAKDGEEPWRKYPDNSAKNFKDPDAFYDSLDKKLYVEFENAKLNIREITNFKDINKVLSKADKYGWTRSSGVGYHPKRQVYVFVTVSEDGKKMLTAEFDAETQSLISSSSNFERKRP
ncbi:hypothetical protein [Robertmurraya kyonggiensis]|uniref:Uncharacterized protein n=1 Tax=Robertmurraya kyonggiensis TaxID=1037680 RepID=A0A4U1DDZ1_9BACI|nr:hypothetical protein [Robertmurraya kyonggiensis]TKC19616.1 hypothetical protein FA727_08790 [Robertmurraya kyonggiensis]